jgi:hypothetical protein
VSKDGLVPSFRSVSVCGKASITNFGSPFDVPCIFARDVSKLKDVAQAWIDEAGQSKSSRVRGTCSMKDEVYLLEAATKQDLMADRLSSYLKSIADGSRRGMREKDGNVLVGYVGGGSARSSWVRAIG